MVRRAKKKRETESPEKKVEPKAKSSDISPGHVKNEVTSSPLGTGMPRRSTRTRKVRPEYTDTSEFNLQKVKIEPGTNSDDLFGHATSDGDSTKVSTGNGIGMFGQIEHLEISIEGAGANEIVYTELNSETGALVPINRIDGTEAQGFDRHAFPEIFHQDPNYINGVYHGLTTQQLKETFESVGLIKSTMWRSIVSQNNLLDNHALMMAREVQYKQRIISLTECVAKTVNIRSKVEKALTRMQSEIGPLERDNKLLNAQVTDLIAERDKLATIHRAEMKANEQRSYHEKKYTDAVDSFKSQREKKVKELETALKLAKKELDSNIKMSKRSAIAFQRKTVQVVKQEVMLDHKICRKEFALLVCFVKYVNGFYRPESVHHKAFLNFMEAKLKDLQLSQSPKVNSLWEKLKASLKEGYFLEEHLVSLYKAIKNEKNEKETDVKKNLVKKIREAFGIDENEGSDQDLDMSGNEVESHIGPSKYLMNLDSKFDKYKSPLLPVINTASSKTNLSKNVLCALANAHTSQSDNLFTKVVARASKSTKAKGGPPTAISMSKSKSKAKSVCGIPKRKRGRPKKSALTPNPEENLSEEEVDALGTLRSSIPVGEGDLHPDLGDGDGIENDFNISDKIEDEYMSKGSKKRLDMPRVVRIKRKRNKESSSSDATDDSESDRSRERTANSKKSLRWRRAAVVKSTAKLDNSDFVDNDNESQRGIVNLSVKAKSGYTNFNNSKSEALSDSDEFGGSGVVKDIYQQIPKDELKTKCEKPDIPNDLLQILKDDLDLSEESDDQNPTSPLPKSVTLQREKLPESEKVKGRRSNKNQEIKLTDEPVDLFDSLSNNRTLRTRSTKREDTPRRNIPGCGITHKELIEVASEVEECTAVSATRKKDKLTPKIAELKHPLSEIEIETEVKSVSLEGKLKTQRSTDDLQSGVKQGRNSSRKALNQVALTPVKERKTVKPVSNQKPAGTPKSPSKFTESKRTLRTRSAKREEVPSRNIIPGYGISQKELVKVAKEVEESAAVFVSRKKDKLNPKIVELKHSLSETEVKSVDLEGELKTQGSLEDLDHSGVKQGRNSSRKALNPTALTFIKESKTSKPVSNQKAAATPKSSSKFTERKSVRDRLGDTTIPISVLAKVKSCQKSIFNEQIMKAKNKGKHENLLDNSRNSVHGKSVTLIESAPQEAMETESSTSTKLSVEISKPVEIAKLKKKRPHSEEYPEVSNSKIASVDNSFQQGLPMPQPPSFHPNMNLMRFPVGMGGPFGYQGILNPYTQEMGASFPGFGGNSLPAGNSDASETPIETSSQQKDGPQNPYSGSMLSYGNMIGQVNPMIYNSMFGMYGKMNPFANSPMMSPFMMNNINQMMNASGDPSTADSSTPQSIMNNGRNMNPMNQFDLFMNPMNPMTNPMNLTTNPMNPMANPMNPMTNPMNPVTNSMNPMTNPMNQFDPFMNPMNQMMNPMMNQMNQMNPMMNQMNPMMNPMNPMNPMMNPMNPMMNPLNLMMTSQNPNTLIKSDEDAVIPKKKKNISEGETEIPSSKFNKAEIRNRSAAYNQDNLGVDIIQNKKIITSKVESNEGKTKNMATKGRTVLEDEVESESDDSSNNCLVIDTRESTQLQQSAELYTGSDVDKSKKARIVLSAEIPDSINSKGFQQYWAQQSLAFGKNSIQGQIRPSPEPAVVIQKYLNPGNNKDVTMKILHLKSDDSGTALSPKSTISLYSSDVEEIESGESINFNDTFDSPMSPCQSPSPRDNNTVARYTGSELTKWNSLAKRLVDHYASSRVMPELTRFNTFAEQMEYFKSSCTVPPSIFVVKAIYTFVEGNVYSGYGHSCGRDTFRPTEADPPLREADHHLLTFIEQAMQHGLFLDFVEEMLKYFNISVLPNPNHELNKCRTVEYIGRFFGAFCRKFRSSETVKDLIYVYMYTRTQSVAAFVHGILCSFNDCFSMLPGDFDYEKVSRCDKLVLFALHNPVNTDFKKGQYVIQLKSLLTQSLKHPQFDSTWNQMALLNVMDIIDMESEEQIQSIIKGLAMLFVQGGWPWFSEFARKHFPVFKDQWIASKFTSVAFGGLLSAIGRASVHSSYDWDLAYLRSEVMEIERIGKINELIEPLMEKAIRECLDGIKAAEDRKKDNEWKFTPTRRKFFDANFLKKRNKNTKKKRQRKNRKQKP